MPGAVATVSEPRRVQLRRTRGWRMPANTVKVSRPGKWSNPFPVAEFGREGAIERYRQHLNALLAAGGLDLDVLRGRNLACWCPLDQPCHADVLLALANAPLR